MLLTEVPITANRAMAHRGRIASGRGGIYERHASRPTDRLNRVGKSLGALSGRAWPNLPANKTAAPPNLHSAAWWAGHKIARSRDRFGIGTRFDFLNTNDAIFRIHKIAAIIAHCPLQVTSHVSDGPRFTRSRCPFLIT